MSPSTTFPKHGVLLQAEVAPKQQAKFEARYKAATKQTVTPGKPKHYQSQPNKLGAELRVYFNDLGIAVTVAASIGGHVEHSRTGYLSGKYRYRVNSNRLWWLLVEKLGLRLGLN